MPNVGVAQYYILYVPQKKYIWLNIDNFIVARGNWGSKMPKWAIHH
jgi:hypothetical protein